MKKGFTLVELLAMIAILGLLALVIIPVVDRTLDKQKERIYDQNVATVVDALKNWTNENISILPEEGEQKRVTLGELKEEGLMAIDFRDPKTKACYSNGNLFRVRNVRDIFSYEVDVLYDGDDCDCQVEPTEECVKEGKRKPSIENADIEVYTSTSTVEVIVPDNHMKDEKSEVTYEISIYLGKKIIDTQKGNRVLFTKLKSNTEYVVEVLGFNDRRNATSSYTKAKTKPITNPQITYTNTPTSSVNGYLSKQVLNTIYYSENIVHPEYYIKSTRTGTTSQNTISVCGDGTVPTECVESKTKNIQANKWYKVEGNISVTYNKTAAETATLYALTFDGTNYSGSVTGTVAKIDAEAPVLTVNSSSSTTNKITLDYTSSDSKTGIVSTTCKYGTASGSYTQTVSNASSTSCTITALTNNKTYYYQICVKDGVGNEKCVTGDIATKDITKPKIELVEKTPTTAVDGYLKSQKFKVTYTKGEVENPKYYIKSNRAATLTDSTLEACGTNTTPGACSTNKTTSIAANTWYRLNGDATVVYNTTATDVATLYAVTHDGKNNKTVNTEVSKIDVTAPTVPTSGNIGNVSGSKTTGSVQTLASGSTDVGVGGITYKYLITNTNAAPSKSNTSFSTSNDFARSCGTSYYAWVVAEDKLGNRSDVKALGNTKDGNNSYSAWSSCSKECDGTQTRTNSCSLVTTGLSQECNSCYVATDEQYSATPSCKSKGTLRSDGTCYYASNDSVCGSDTTTYSCKKTCTKQECRDVEDKSVCLEYNKVKLYDSSSFNAASNESCETNGCRGHSGCSCVDSGNLHDPSTHGCTCSWPNGKYKNGTCKTYGTKQECSTSSYECDGTCSSSVPRSCSKKESDGYIVYSCSNGDKLSDKTCHHYTCPNGGSLITISSGTMCRY